MLPEEKMPGEKCESRKRGNNNRVQNKVLRNRTGITAFPFTEVFLLISYNPKKKADTKAKAIHIPKFVEGAKLRKNNRLRRTVEKNIRQIGLRMSHQLMFCQLETILCIIFQWFRIHPPSNFSDISISNIFILKFSSKINHKFRKNLLNLFEENFY